MAKKIVRGITDVKTINNQDFDTNNVNDLLSDGQYNYIHRKKGKSEEYHNLTDNIKTLSSDNTDLLAVTNNNKTNNTATLHPKHDAQKEQVLESTRSTINIHHGTNGTTEKTTVDTNPQKVLEHENLISNSQYVTIEHEEDTNTSEIKTDKLVTKLNELDNKIPTTVGTVNLFKNSRDFTGSYWLNTTNGFYAEDYQGVKIFKTNTTWSGRSQYFEVKNGEEYVFSAYVKSSVASEYIGFYLVHDLKQPKASGLVSFGSESSQDSVFLEATNEYKRIVIKIKITKDGWIMPRLERPNEDAYLFFGGYKLESGKIPSDYSPSFEDVYPLLAQKQNTIQNNTSIGVVGTGLMQLYHSKQEYTHDNGLLKTHVKSLSANTSVNTAEEEFNFTLKINQGTQEVTFTLEEQDKTRFNKIITTYGVNSSVRINGCLFTLSDSTLTVTTDANTGNNLVITFSEII